jgi:uncharacterized membrane protein
MTTRQSLCLIEIAVRGHSHWSMSLAGGLTLMLLYVLQVQLAERSLRLRCLVGALLITAIELAFGIAFNLYLGLNVWNYSHLPANFLGQISPFFTLLWFLLCIPVFIALSRLQVFWQKTQLRRQAF